MAVKSDPKLGGFSHFYDDEIDDDEDDNHFIISLEDNGDEEELAAEFNSENQSKKLQDDYSLPAKIGDGNNLQFTGQHVLSHGSYKSGQGPWSFSSSSASNHVADSSEMEILTFPTSCISKPNTQTISYSNQISHGTPQLSKTNSHLVTTQSCPSVHSIKDFSGLRFASTSTQKGQNSLNPLALPDYLKKAASATISHSHVYSQKESYKNSDTVLLTTEAESGLSDSVTLSCASNVKDTNFVNIRTQTSGDLGYPSILSALTKSTIGHGSFLGSSSSLYKSKNITQVSNASHMQADVPRLSGPFPKSQKIVFDHAISSSQSSDPNHCSCIMCYKGVLKHANDSTKNLPHPQLTQEEAQIIQRDESACARQRRKSVAKTNIIVTQAEPLELNHIAPSLTANQNFALPKLTMSRDLSIATSNDKLGFRRTANGQWQVSNEATASNVTPPLLLHKSAMNRNYPVPSSTSTSLLTTSSITTASVQVLQVPIMQQAKAPTMIIMPSNSSKGQLNNCIEETTNNKSANSSTSIPLLLTASTKATKIGSLVLNNTAMPLVSSQSQGVMTNSVRYPQTKASIQPVPVSSQNTTQVPPLTTFRTTVHMDCNDLQNPKTSQSQPTTRPVINNFHKSTEVPIPSIPALFLPSVGVTNDTISGSEMGNPSLKSVSLLNTSAALQKLNGPTVGDMRKTLHQGAYQIVYVSSDEVLLCRNPLKPTSQQTSQNCMITKQVEIPPSQSKQAISRIQPDTVTVNGQHPALSSVLRKAEQIDLTTPGSVRIRLKEVQSQDRSPKKLSNSNSSSTVNSSQSATTSSSVPQTQRMPQNKPLQKSPIKTASLSPQPTSVGVTGSTLLKLIDTHFENQKLTSSETALLHLIKGACKDPEVLAATCKIAQQVEAASSSKIAKNSNVSIPVTKSVSKDTSPPAAVAVAENDASLLLSKISSNPISRSDARSQPFILKTSGGNRATKVKLANTSNQAVSPAIPRSDLSSHLKHPSLPQESLPPSYVEDWVNQTKSFMSENDYDDVFHREIMSVDRKIAKEFLHSSESPLKNCPNSKPVPRQNIKSSQRKQKLKPKVCEDEDHVASLTDINSKALSKEPLIMNGKEPNFSVESSQVKSSHTTFTPFSIEPHDKKSKHVSSIIASSKGIKLKIRLDGKLKRRFALKKKSFGKRLAKAHRSSVLHKAKSESPNKPMIHNDKKDIAAVPKEGTSKEITLNAEKEKGSKTETAEEMFQRFQEQAQEEVYKAQLGVGYLSRSLRPMRTTMAFLDKMPRDILPGEQKKNKTEVDSSAGPKVSGNDDKHQDKDALTKDKQEIRSGNKDKKIGAIRKRRLALPSPNRHIKSKEQNVGHFLSHYPKLKEDTSFPFTKSVYCSNILAGHQVFVKFNTYENSNTKRCFLVPFFNIGGKRKQFDMEDVNYFNKAVIEIEKEERSCARHLLYFCREGNKASFLRKESNFSTCQLHEKNYKKKSFVLEGFKMDAAKPKPLEETELWKVDKEVAIEIDTAEVDNDIETDFVDNPISAAVECETEEAVATKETLSSNCWHGPPFQTCTKQSFSSILPQASASSKETADNYGQVNVSVYDTCKSVVSSSDANLAKSAAIQKLCNSSVSPFQTDNASTGDNAVFPEPLILEIKKEKPDDSEYENLFLSSSRMPESASFNISNIKEEPNDDFLWSKSGFNSSDDVGRSFSAEAAEIIRSEAYSEKNMLKCKKATFPVNAKDQPDWSTPERLKEDFSTVSVRQLELEKANHISPYASEQPIKVSKQNGLKDKNHHSDNFESSSILCREVLSCDAGNVEVSLSDTQMTPAYDTNPEHSVKPINCGQVEVEQFKQVTQEGTDSVENKEDSEVTATGSEIMPSSPKSPAPSSPFSESSQVSDSSDLGESDLEDIEKEDAFPVAADFTHTGVPSKDNMADTENKNGPVQQKITSLVESLRQRLTQETSVLPLWLANDTPRVIHSKIRTRKKKLGKSKSQAIIQPTDSSDVSETATESSAAKILSNVSDNATVKPFTPATVPGSLPLSLQSTTTFSVTKDSLPVSTMPVQTSIYTSITPEASSANVNFDAVPNNTPSQALMQISNNTHEDPKSKKCDPPEKVSVSTEMLSNKTKDKKLQIDTENVLASETLFSGSSGSMKTMLSPSHSTPAQNLSNAVKTVELNKTARTNNQSFEKLSIKKEIIDAEEYDNNSCTLPLASEENVFFPPSNIANPKMLDIQQSCRSTPSDIDIEIGCDDLPETAMQFCPIVPDADVNVLSSQSDEESSSQSSCLSPVAAVVDYLHKRTQSLNQNHQKSTLSKTSSKADLCSQNVAEEQKGSVASYLSQKYSEDMTPGSGVWHTIKGPRLRKAASSKFATDKLQRPAKPVVQATPSTISAYPVEPISTEELSKKPSLSEIFGIPITPGKEPQQEQKQIKSEPSSDSFGAVKIKELKKQVARKRTFARKDITDHITTFQKDLPVPTLDPCESKNCSRAQAKNQDTEPCKSQYHDVPTVKDVKSADSSPKIRMTWRQLSKLSEKQEKESEKQQEKQEKENLLKKIRSSPCWVLLSRLEETDLSFKVEPINSYTFKVKEEPLDEINESDMVKKEKNALEGDANDWNKCKRLKRKKKKMGTGRSRRSSVKPKKDIVDHFASMLDSLRKKAVQLEEEAKKKQEEKELKKKDETDEAEIHLRNEVKVMDEIMPTRQEQESSELSPNLDEKKLERAPVVEDQGNGLVKVNEEILNLEKREDIIVHHETNDEEQCEMVKDSEQKILEKGSADETLQRELEAAKQGEIEVWSAIAVEEKNIEEVRVTELEKESLESNVMKDQPKETFGKRAMSGENIKKDNAVNEIAERQINTCDDVGGENSGHIEKNWRDHANNDTPKNESEQQCEPENRDCDLVKSKKLSDLNDGKETLEPETVQGEAKSGDCGMRENVVAAKNKEMEQVAEGSAAKTPEATEMSNASFEKKPCTSETNESIEECTDNVVEEEDISLDWDEPGALVIHLPEDEGKDKPVATLGVSEAHTMSPVFNQSIGDNLPEDDSNLGKTLSCDMGKKIVPHEKNIEACQSNEERGNLHSQKSDNPDIPLSSEDYLKAEENNEQFIGLGNNHIRNTRNQERVCTSSDNSAWFDHNAVPFPKMDVVLSSVLDEDFADCFYEKTAKKDTMVMFEQQDDLDGDDMGTIPQDEVERLIGLCDEDTEPVILPGLGPFSKSNRGSFSSTHDRPSRTFCRQRSEEESLSTGLLNVPSTSLSNISPCYPQLITRNDEICVKGNEDNAGQNIDSFSSKKSEASATERSMPMTACETYPLPSQTTVLSPYTSRTTNEKCSENKSLNTSNLSSKPDLTPVGQLKLPKLQLKLDANALAAIQKVKSAFVKKNHMKQKRNLQSDKISAPKASSDSQSQSQFEKDMEFYTRSTSRKRQNSSDLSSREPVKEQSSSSTKTKPATRDPCLEATETVCRADEKIPVEHNARVSKDCGYDEKKLVANQRQSPDIRLQERLNMVKTRLDSPPLSNETLRKRKSSELADSEKSCPSAIKVKKIESIFEDSDIFKESQLHLQTQLSATKQTKPSVPVDELLKKTKGIDLSKLKMKLNPVLSKNVVTSSSLKSMEYKQSENSKSVRKNMSSNPQTDLCKEPSPNRTLKSVKENMYKSTKSINDESPLNSSPLTLSPDHVNKSDNSKQKPLPNLNTAKLCNLLKNIQKKPGAISYGKVSNTTMEKQLDSPNLESVVMKMPKQESSSKTSNRVLRGHSSGKTSNGFHQSVQTSQKRQCSKNATGDKGQKTREANEETEGRSERSFFDCLSTDQTEVWEEATKK